MPTLDRDAIIGRATDELTIGERSALAGTWVAFEIYTTARTPERRISAAGPGPGDCIRQLRDRGLDPRLFEFVVLSAAF